MLRLYMDEDAMEQALVGGLRARGDEQKSVKTTAFDPRPAQADAG
jgi:hypothetical protein